jgi:hypothetical protein
VAIHPASVQDRDGVALVLDRKTRRLFPFIERIYGDGGYQGPKAATAAAKTGRWTIEIVARLAISSGSRLCPSAGSSSGRWPGSADFAASRFRALRQNCRRLNSPRHDPHHAEAARRKPFIMNPNFTDGL